MMQLKLVSSWAPEDRLLYAQSTSQRLHPSCETAHVVPLDGKEPFGNYFCQCMPWDDLLQRLTPSGLNKPELNLANKFCQGGVFPDYA